MRHYAALHWITNSCLWLAIFIGALPARAQAGQPSAMSRWLSNDLVPELQQLLSRHPRYEGQRVQVVAASQDGLSGAIAAELESKLAGLDGIVLVSRGSLDPQPPGAGDSIDALDCQGGPGYDYLLRAQASSVAGGHGRVVFELLDVNGVVEPARSWQWRGKFDAAERRQLQQALAPASADGSLTAPFGDSDLNAAASTLSRELACALRPHIHTRLDLQWPQHASLPALFADTANTTRAMLGNYRQLGISDVGSDYQVEVRIEPYRDDIWQFWLTGTPHRNDLVPVQAVTYFKVSDPGGSNVTGQVVAAALPKLAVPANRGEALDFIDVELLDATQTDRGGSRADLQVTLRIGNRAAWPIEYAFTLSGGHFNYCVSRPDYYRHDRYGQVAGQVDAGSSVVRRLVIENTRHSPTPLFGSRKCAGFRDLDGFEEFSEAGHRVTDYVRWEM
jgi:hypothetical protein